MADVEYEAFQDVNAGKTIPDQIQAPENVYRLTHDVSLDNLTSPQEADTENYLNNCASHVLDSQSNLICSRTIDTSLADQSPVSTNLFNTTTAAMVDNHFSTEKINDMREAATADTTAKTDAEKVDDVSSNALAVKEEEEGMVASAAGTQFGSADLSPLAPLAQSPSPMSISTCSERSLADELQEVHSSSSPKGSVLAGAGSNSHVDGLRLQLHHNHRMEYEEYCSSGGSACTNLSGPKALHTGQMGASRCSSSSRAALLHSDNKLLCEDASPDSLQLCSRSLAVAATANSASSTATESVSKSKPSNYKPATLKQEKAAAACGEGGAAGSSCMGGGSQATHRGLHKFVPRHEDEIAIDVGDALLVQHEADDLWCDGINLRTGQEGIFPFAYACDIEYDTMFDPESQKHKTARFMLKFLGSVEVSCHKGNSVLCQAMSKIAQTRRMTLNTQPPPICIVEINEHGIRMVDKSRHNNEKFGALKETIGRMFGRQKVSLEGSSPQYDHFFALKNVTFCGYHPKNHRYFGFITKHPSQVRFACHVFIGDKSTQPVAEAVGSAFRYYYDEYHKYTASSHPTEDIYME